MSSSKQNTEQEDIKIIIMCDATGSMGSILASLEPVLGELIPMCNILFESCKIALLFYFDYDSTHKTPDTVVRFQNYTSDEKILRDFIHKYAKPDNGGDYPEAQKTALMVLLTEQVLDKNTLVLHYTDAPYHSDSDNSGEAKKEKEHFASMGWDHSWKSIVSKCKDTNATFITFCSNAYLELGKYVSLNTSHPSTIMQGTMGALQQELGIEGEGNPNFKISFSSISSRLKNENYFQRVVNILQAQLSNRGIEGAIDILCNKVTSEVWRSLVGFRNNEKVIHLKNVFSNLANGSTEKHKELQSLIEQSFDRKAAINELIGKLEGPHRVLCRSMRLKIPVKDLQDLFGKFEREAIAAMLLLIQTLEERIEDFSSEPDVEFADREVALLDVPDQTFFSIITHLVTPGYITSPRQTAIIAFFALRDLRFQERASNYLNAIKGKWLDLSLLDEAIGGFKFPENLNISFVNFLLNHQEFLTFEESAFFKAFLNMSNIYRSKDFNLSLKVSQRPNAMELPCPLFECERCKQLRPVAIQLAASNICGICDTESDASDASNIISTEKPKHYSCRTCNAVYPVCRPELLNVIPKCYYCRNPSAGNAPLRCCKICKLNYIHSQNNNNNINLQEEFICPVCTESGHQTESLECPISLLFSTNEKTLEGVYSISIGVLLKLLMDKSFNKPLTLFYRYALSQTTDQFHDIKPLIENFQGISLLSKNNLHIFNSAELLTNVLKQFTRVRVIDEIDCMICCSTFTALQMRNICMRNDCAGKVCIQCAYQWLSGARPGQLIEYSQCSCPFCRREFDRAIAKFHPIGALKIPASACEESRQHYMAWCCSCNNMKIHSRRECNVQPPELNNFICEDCTNARNVRNNNVKNDGGNQINVGENKDRIVNCRNCNAPVCKALIINGIVNTGCNHVQCLACNSEVCAFTDCGMAFPTSGECYEHMQSVHGDFYDSGVFDD